MHKLLLDSPIQVELVRLLELCLSFNFHENVVLVSEANFIWYGRQQLVRDHSVLQEKFCVFGDWT